MTTKHVVADDVLGKISRKVWELYRRVFEGSVDLGRVLFFLQEAIEGAPKSRQEESSWGTYLLENLWSWDNAHREFATICIEKCDSSIPPEEILNTSVPEEKKEWLLNHLKRLFYAQVPSHGLFKMVRLYRVAAMSYFDYNPNWGQYGILSSEEVDVHLTLRPLFDFDENGNPVPCVIEKT